MFEELPLIFGFLLFSNIVSYLLFRYIQRPLDRVVKFLSIIGIVIHESFHVFMCIITHAPIKNVKLLERIPSKGNRGNIKYEYSGKVVVNDEKRLSFLQALLIGLAPLIFSFWLFFRLWDFLYYNLGSVSVLLFFAIAFVMISIIIAASPSSTDLFCVTGAFQEDLRYSCYQIVLLLLSVASVMLIPYNYKLAFLREVYYYVLIMVIYYCWKYSFKGIKNGVNHFRTRKMMPFEKELKYTPYVRRRHKPAKPKALGREEAHW